MTAEVEVIRNGVPHEVVIESKLKTKWGQKCIVKSAKQLTV